MKTLTHYFQEVDEAAVRRWMQDWRAQHPQAGVLALVAERDKEQVAMLQRCAIDAELPLTGAVFPELVVQSHFQKQGVLLCGLDPMPAYRLIGQLSKLADRNSVVQAMQALVQTMPEDEGTLMMVFDGLYGQIGSLLDDLFYALGSSCHYAGINAGSETFQPMACLFDRERWIDDGLLALALPAHAGAELEHGYEVPDEALAASAANGNRITQIDWQPAFDKYAELIQRHYGEQLTRENFYSMGVHFPFALMRADGQTLIRIPVAVDDEGALFCVGEVPEGVLLSVARAVTPGSAHTVERLGGRYRQRQAASGLFFYCAGRRMHLGEQAAEEELQQLERAVSPQAILGALTLGEIGHSPGGYPLFHNATLVALPLT